MAVDYTTDALIASLQRNGLIPNDQETFEDEDFIAMLNEELQSVITPLIMSTNQDYFLQKVEYPVVANQQAYAVPPGAIGMKLKSVHIVDTSGNPNNQPRLDLASIASDPGVAKAGFFVQSNDIMLYPVPTSTSGDIVRLYYYARPNDLTRHGDWLCTGDSCEHHDQDHQLLHHPRSVHRGERGLCGQWPPWF
jgi:hypothetical protein